MEPADQGHQGLAGGLNHGSVVQENGYDGLGRRIVKTVENSGGSGDLGATYHYYLEGASGGSVVELRNGSDLVLKQYVWANLAGQYVDELVQVAINGDPIEDPDFDPSDPDHDPRKYWALQDANFNVLGIVDGGGELVERYTYTPYGQRTVYFSLGATDPLCYGLSMMSRRVVVGGIAQPYGLLEPGHQGLFHDEELDLIYNRARHLHPTLGRFMQRDPLGYVDGMSVYLAGHYDPTILDPTGLRNISLKFEAFIPKTIGIAIANSPVSEVNWASDWFQAGSPDTRRTMFNTDNRENASESGSSKLYLHMTMDVRKIGNMLDGDVKYDVNVGTTHRIRVTRSSSIQRLRRVFGPWQYVPGSYASARGPYGDSGLKVWNLPPQQTHLFINAWGKYPFAPRYLTPAINFDLKIFVRCRGRKIEMSVRGSHDFFPAYGLESV